MFNDKSILITGGTGSFGRKYTATILARYKPRRLVIFSRDELKQYEMSQVYNHECVRYFLGDAEPALFVCRPEQEAEMRALAAGLGVPRVETLSADGGGSLVAAALQASPDFDDV